MRKLIVAAATALVIGVGATPLAAAGAMTAAPAAPAACEVTWGSLPEERWVQSVATINNLRAGRNECYDRLVVDLGPGAAAGYVVSYVPQVTQDGSGFPVPLAGGAFLQIAVFAPGHDGNYNPTYHPADPRHAVNVSGFSTFRQVAWLGTFEATSGIGLGVRARLPFRVFNLAGPGSGSRLVIDVAHHW